MSVVTRVPTRLPITPGVALLLAAVGFLLYRWWIGPTPEGEAQEYFDRQAPGVVEVIDCEYAEAGRSVFDRYYCVLRAEGVVPHPPGMPGIATVTAGRRGYCFSIPRAGDPFVRRDGDAAPYYPATDVRECGGGG